MVSAVSEHIEDLKNLDKNIKLLTESVFEQTKGNAALFSAVNAMIESNHKFMDSLENRLTEKNHNEPSDVQKHGITFLLSVLPIGTLMGSLYMGLNNNMIVAIKDIDTLKTAVQKEQAKIENMVDVDKKLNLKIDKLQKSIKYQLDLNSRNIRDLKIKASK